MLRWSPTTLRKIITARDRIMFGAGTSEPWIREDEPELRWSAQWRKPLRVDEVNQMAATPEVRQRPGRA